MFDPTAFENIKVVIEGEIYDRDLSGEIIVVDRNDWINTAKLSRKYEISFTLNDYPAGEISAAMTLEAGLENLSAELLGKGRTHQLAGCEVGITFSLLHKYDDAIFQIIQKELDEIWGSQRVIAQAVHLAPLREKPLIRNVASISFNRLVYEEQIDDLTEMIEYMVDSLIKLKKIIE
ncbi:hypothetical protein [Mesobacillus jeotgali]|uniref:hypothetical protein n=1 Tax=Mesobacillus jeotgali TaxID=129985 RepID=UPI0009A7FF89|nr:hypothetical protein [Mesobacillus jeotgali]